MATVLQGAVIIEQKGNRVVYRRKCEKCGDVSRCDTSTQINTGSNYSSQFTCMKCKNNQKIQIKG